VCCVLAVVFGIIMYRVIVLATLFIVQDEIVNKFAKIVTSLTAAVISLIAILILSRVSNTLILNVQLQSLCIVICML